MILTVSAENTDILIGAADEKTGGIVFENAVSADVKKTPAEYMIIFDRLLAINGLNPKDIGGGIIASCVPPLTDTLKEAMSGILHTGILEVGPGIRTGVDIRIDDPAELGADLIVTAAAGIAEYGAPLIIINSGTLITYSVIDAERHFIGALFQPGIRLSAAAVSSNAANLPATAVRKTVKLIGTNTVESIQSGIFNGCAASIDGLIDKISAEIGCSGTSAVITGEYAGLLAETCIHEIHVDEGLSMKGLIMIYNKNRRR